MTTKTNISTTIIISCISQIEGIIQTQSERHVKRYWLDGCRFIDKINNSRSIKGRVSVFVIGISDGTWMKINSDTGGIAVWKH
jgi:hypothetical protein